MKNQKRSKSSISINHLPDEVLVEIFRRISVTDLLKYCRVCKNWKYLISSKDFKDMHVRSFCSPTMVLVSSNDVYGDISDLLLLKNIWDTTRKRLTIRKFVSSLAFSCSLIFTYQGLMIFYDYNTRCGDLMIFNPVSGDKLTVSPPIKDCIEFTIFGMFLGIISECW